MVAVVAAVVTALTLGGVALGYYAATGTGTGSVTTGTLNSPTAVAGSQVPGTSTVAVSWAAPTGPTAPTGYYVLRAPSPNGPVSAACGSSFAAPVSGTSCTDTAVPVGAFTYVVVALHQTWTAASAPSAVVNVAQTTQTITITSSPSAPTVGGSYLITATGGASGNPVLFSTATPGVCTVSGATASFVHAGTCTIQADQAGNSEYDPAPQVQQTFPVARASQVVTFTSTAPSDAVVGGAGYSPAATGGASANSVLISIDASTAANCSISGGLVTYQHVGSCTVNADQAGDADYLAAPQAQQSFAIGQGAQAINFISAAPVDAKVSGSNYSVSASGGGSGNPVAFSSATPTVCTVSGSTVSFVGAGLCTINANQGGNVDYLAASQVQQSFGVTKNDQSVTFTSTAPGAATYQGATYAVAAAASSGLSVALAVDGSSTSVCSLSGSVVSFTGVGTCTINANQTGNFAFNAAPQVQQSFSVAKASQTISFGALANRTYGNAPFTVSATSTAGLTVAFSSATAPICTVSGTTVTIVAAGTCTINANQAGNGYYNAASQVQQSFTVAKANQTVTFNQPTSPATATTTATLIFSTTSGLPVTITPTDGTVCSVSGATVTYLKAGSCVLTATQPGDSNYGPATPVSRTVTVNLATQAITFNQPTTPADVGTSTVLTGTASSGLPVAFTTPSAASVCTITGGSTVNYVGAGNCVINADQSGDATYAAAPQVQRTVAVQGTSFTISSRVSSPPQNTTAVDGTGTPGAAVTVYLCNGTQATCGAGGPSLKASDTATVAPDGTWAVSFSKLGNGAATYTVQAYQTAPAANARLVFTTN